MTHEWKHPNYYKRLKELQKKDMVPQEQDQEEQQKEETEDKKED
jgi:hypothetical protein